MASLKKLLKQNKIHRPEHIAYNVHWAIILILGLGLVCGVLTGAVYVYKGVSQGTLVTAGTDQGEIVLDVINEKQLTAVTDSIVEIEELKKSIETGGALMSDPAK